MIGLVSIQSAEDLGGARFLMYISLTKNLDGIKNENANQQKSSEESNKTNNNAVDGTYKQTLHNKIVVVTLLYRSVDNFLGLDNHWPSTV